MSATRLLPALLVTLSMAFPVDAEPLKDRWNLESIYADAEAWGGDARALEKDLEAFGECEGRLGSSAGRLKGCLDRYFDLRRRLERLSSYASMKYDENTKVAASLDLKQRADILYTRFGEVTAFVDPEILAIGAGTIDRFLRQDPGLATYRHILDDILRRAPHTLSKEGEALLASASMVTGAPEDLYGILANADMPWVTFEPEPGKSMLLSQSTYSRYRGSTDRALRKRLFETFWPQWQKFQRTFGVSLYSQMKRDWFYAKSRNYPSSLAAALGNGNIPEKVYHTLIEQTNANLDTLHRYFRLRGRMLGIDDLRYYDIYPPIVDADPEIDIEKAKRLVLEAVEPLGEEYVSVMREGFGSRWMDVYPRPGKRSGAYMNGAVYDMHPFVLMNYNDDYDSLSTLAHEWGHALHSWLSNRNQPYHLADYSIFLAEVASTFNEDLLLDRLLKEAKDDRERLFYLGNALEQYRGTFFRQAMFAEYELKIHQAVERGESLSGERFSEIYLDLLRRYHGHDKGVMTVDDLYAIEWAYIPHFYYNFYVYQYATSIAASSLLAREVAAGDIEARERYLELLKSGDSDYPYELLKRAGVDLASPEPYRALVRRMNEIMDAIEEILDGRKG